VGVKVDPAKEIIEWPFPKSLKSLRDLSDLKGYNFFTKIRCNIFQLFDGRYQNEKFYK